MTLTVADLRAAIARLAVAMDAAFDAQNTADGALGDGDLGVTMRRGSAAMAERALSDDLGQALLQCAQAFTKVSGSSFGTLMAMAKALKGHTSVDPGEISTLIAAAAASAAAPAQEEMRGKLATVGRARIFGEKTIGRDDPGMLAMTLIARSITGQG